MGRVRIKKHNWVILLPPPRLHSLFVKNAVRENIALKDAVSNGRDQNSAQDKDVDLIPQD